MLPPSGPVTSGVRRCSGCCSRFPNLSKKIGTFPADEKSLRHAGAHGLTLASACHVPGLSAAVSFYGIPPADKADYAKATIPVQMHVAKKDGWVTPEKAEEVKKQLKDVELHLYDADHAFVNDTRPEVYDAANAKLAWERAVGFFKKHLG